LICPNCKTELIEVNGRYICSDCGREIPENEVMAADWGNGGTVRAGLYGAGTDEPEAGTAPVTDFDALLTENENVKAPEETVEQVLQTQENAVSTPPVTEPVTDTGFYTNAEPASETVAPVEEVIEPQVDAEPMVSSLGVDTAAPESTSDPVIQAATPVIPSARPNDQQVGQVAEESLSNSEPSKESSNPNPGSFPPKVGQAVPTQDGTVNGTVPSSEFIEETPPTPIPIVPAPQEVPKTTPPFESISAPGSNSVAPEVAPEVIPEHSEVVKDMFETSEALAEDPGIYTDPIYDTNPATNEPAAPTANQNIPMASDKRTNMIVLIAGSILLLLLVGGGIWAYLAVSAKTPVVAPVVTDTTTTTWQELQVVDGGFKISFPGKPDQTEVTQAVNGADTALASYTYTSDDITYAASFVTLDDTSAKAITDNLQTALPFLVEEIATAQGLTASDTKIGTYYTANAIDFKLASDTASYQAKLMIHGNDYILIMAGSSSGQTVDYTKFIKSFSFITTESTQ